MSESLRGRIDRLDAMGRLQSYELGSDSDPEFQVAADGHGGAWFPEMAPARLGHITAAGALFTCQLADRGAKPIGTVAVGDLAYFGATGGLVTVTLDGRSLRRISLRSPATHVLELARAADGTVWFTADHPVELGRLQPGASTPDEFPLGEDGGTAIGIAVSTLGDVWYSRYGANKLGRRAADGSITEQATTGIHPNSMTSAPDGSIWVCISKSNQVARILPDANRSITYQDVPGNWPDHAVALADGVWITEYYGETVVRLVTP